MQKEIHPSYFPAAVVTCACGNTFSVGSTKEKIEVEICSACHPFYSGEDKVIDTAGRVEKFKTRRSQAAVAPRARKPVLKAKKKAIRLATKGGKKTE
jgi:large subunit ribosomal protein L31